MDMQRQVFAVGLGHVEYLLDLPPLTEQLTKSRSVPIVFCIKDVRFFCWGCLCSSGKRSRPKRRRANENPTRYLHHCDLSIFLL